MDGVSVYQALLRIATEEDELEALGITRAEAEKWSSEWDISSEQKGEFLRSIADAYIKTGKP